MIKTKPTCDGYNTQLSPPPPQKKKQIILCLDLYFFSLLVFLEMIAAEKKK